MPIEIHEAKLVGVIHTLFVVGTVFYSVKNCGKEAILFDTKPRRFKMNTIQKSDDADGIKLVKSGTCLSLSGKSKLTYHVGLSQAREVLLRVVQNSNSGCFNPDWVDVRALHAAFDKVPKGQSVTADNLVALFRGKSMNTPFFLFAVMKCEGLVETSKADKRRYERVDPKGFIAGVQGIAGSAQPKGGATNVARSARPKKSTASKKS